MIVLDCLCKHSEELGCGAVHCAMRDVEDWERNSVSYMV